jgi:hypothetical protein
LCAGAVVAGAFVIYIRCGRGGVKMKRQEENRKNQKNCDRTPSKREFGQESLDDHTP